uniref:Uncharacterized protein n=1 Tax=Rhizophora mucronata TaxID=61149 RepID=A0A2P2LX58_RHIMU
MTFCLIVTKDCETALPLLNSSKWSYLLNYVFSFFLSRVKPLCFWVCNGKPSEPEIRGIVANCRII